MKKKFKVKEIMARPELEDAIDNLFIPAVNLNGAEELYKTIDLWDILNPICGASFHEVEAALKTIGFRQTTLKGEKYWLIKNTQ